MEVHERIELQRLITRLEEFVALNSDCTVRQAIAFLNVALNPGINITELAKRSGATITSASRHFRAFSVEEFGENGLIASHYSDGRSKALNLSDRGQCLASSLAQRTHLVVKTGKDAA